jgi:recombinational DNA repair protein RecR
MKRTKEWWARLAPDERAHLVYIERYQNKSAVGSAYLPDGVGECPACGQLSTYGLCEYCSNSRKKYIEKANKIVSENQNSHIERRE